MVHDSNQIIYQLSILGLPLAFSFFHLINSYFIQLDQATNAKANQAIKVDVDNKWFCISIRNMPMHIMKAFDQQEYVRATPLTVFHKTIMHAKTTAQISLN